MCVYVGEYRQIRWLDSSVDRWTSRYRGIISIYLSNYLYMYIYIYTNRETMETCNLYLQNSEWGLCLDGDIALGSYFRWALGFDSSWVTGIQATSGWTWGCLRVRGCRDWVLYT